MDPYFSKMFEICDLYPIRIHVLKGHKIIKNCCLPNVNEATQEGAKLSAARLLCFGKNSPGHQGNTRASLCNDPTFLLLLYLILRYNQSLYFWPELGQSLMNILRRLQYGFSV